MRGRGRKMPNHANRVYESNGPDVKIRGTAAHIAEKYTNMSRDAQSSGDPIAAENYMQHAEHYLRIVAAAQAQQQAQQQPQQQNSDQSDDEDDNPRQQSANGSSHPVNAGQDGEGAANVSDNDSDGDTERQPRGRRRRRASGDDAPEASASNGSGHSDQDEENAPDGAKIAQAIPAASTKTDQMNGSDGSEDSASEEPAEQPA